MDRSETDSDSESVEDSPEGPGSKVARLIRAYDLGAGYGDRLEELWTADGDERESLRTLADRFNRRLLEAAMMDAGMSPLDGEVANFYRLVVSDDVSSGVRTEARQRLKRNGVEIERLERDFVTYQAIRSYLTGYRGIDYRTDDGGDRVETVAGTVQCLQSRAHRVVEKSLTQLRDTDRLSLGEFRLFVRFTVLCEDCGTQFGVTELLEEDGCECE